MLESPHCAEVSVCFACERVGLNVAFVVVTSCCYYDACVICVVFCLFLAILADSSGCERSLT